MSIQIDTSEDESSDDIDTSENESTNDKSDYEASKKIIRDIIHDDGESVDESEIETHLDLLRDTELVLLLILLLIYFVHQICLGLQ
jgi:hypothetical protein